MAATGAHHTIGLVTASPYGMPGPCNAAQRPRGGAQSPLARSELRHGAIRLSLPEKNQPRFCFHCLLRSESQHGLQMRPVAQSKVFTFGTLTRRSTATPPAAANAKRCASDAPLEAWLIPLCAELVLSWLWQRMTTRGGMQPPIALHTVLKIVWRQLRLHQLHQ